MTAIGIASIVSVIGAGAGLFLAHRLVGFRPDGGSQAGELRSQDASWLSLEKLSMEVMELRGSLARAEALGEAQASMLNESQEEVRSLRVALYDVQKRQQDSEESRHRQERELTRRQKRELERHRERELEESSLHRRRLDRPVATR